MEDTKNTDISLSPGPSSDPIDEVRKCISGDIMELYDVYSYRHAASILKHAFPRELKEIEDALRNFRITTVDIGTPGGNESTIPKKISTELRPKKWFETRIQGDLSVRVVETQESVLSDGSVKKSKPVERETIVLNNFIDGHKIDYVKEKVAFDLEWNSKDQTFDRDLYAFRMFHECGAINVAILLTRSEKLNPLFDVIPRRDKNGIIIKKAGREEPCKQKYGASTTWMGKLIYRLNAGRHGGCPVLALGIKPEVVEDWPLK